MMEVVVIDHHSPGELLTKEEKDGEIIGELLLLMNMLILM